MEQSTLRIIDNIRKVATQMDAILQRDLWDAASRLQEQMDLIERMRAEMVNPDDLSQQLLKLIAGMNEAKAAQVRPEPSRLEIAAIVLLHDEEQCGDEVHSLTVAALVRHGGQQHAQRALVLLQQQQQLRVLALAFEKRAEHAEGVSVSVSGRARAAARLEQSWQQSLSERVRRVNE
jgi:hypothetical protein